MTTAITDLKRKDLVKAPVAVDFTPGGGYSHLRQIALLGTFPPRQCGIATYTADVLSSLRGACPQADVFAMAVSKGDKSLPYPSEVAMELRDNSPESYREAATYLNGLKPDVLCVQHEYGIFGGSAGSHLFELLENRDAPVVTVMHTVLAEPGPDVREATARLLRASDRVIVMTRFAADLLRRVHGQNGTPPIDIIPHGIPDVPFRSTASFKAELGLEDRFVLLTFGLLGPGKGIEYAIDAMPRVVEADPTAVYVILGATHPCLVEHEGEKYRESLMERARSLGVENNVLFVNRYVDMEELTRFLGAADIYVTPYLNEAQITSGTLAYASGSGKPVVSTPYWHAKELITPDRGRLVPFRDSAAMADAIRELIENPALRESMRVAAYKAGRQSTWAEVGKRFARSCAAAGEAAKSRAILRREYPPQPLASHPSSASGVKVIFPFTPSKGHLRAMLTPLGIWQHARGRQPDERHGFCTDDNARTLLLAHELGAGWEKTADDCLRFLEEAWNPAKNRFRNFRDAEGKWLEEAGSPDSTGRTLWALGVTAGTAGPLRERARVLLRESLGALQPLPDLRPFAFAALGLEAALRFSPAGEDADLWKSTLRGIALKLGSAFHRTAGAGWEWFEEKLTYDNARLPHALFVAGRLLGDRSAADCALRALGWLMRVQRAQGGHFRPVGCNGWMSRGDRQPAVYDQQALEAWASTSACLAAWRAGCGNEWLNRARRSYLWFLGGNDAGLSLYDPTNGGVYDGLHPGGVNLNQGAESVLSFHLAHVEMTAAGASASRQEEQQLLTAAAH